MELMQEILKDFAKQAIDKFESRFKEACTIWGVNLNDHEEIKRRCTVVEYEDSPIKDFRIDGAYVMSFTEMTPDPINFDEPTKMSASFSCSEIVKPSKKLNKF